MQGAMLGLMNIETIKSDTIPVLVELNLQFWINAKSLEMV